MSLTNGMADPSLSEYSDMLSEMMEINAPQNKKWLNDGETLTIAQFVEYLSKGGRPPKRIEWDGIVWVLTEQGSPLQNYVDERTLGTSNEEPLPVCLNEFHLKNEVIIIGS